MADSFYGRGHVTGKPTRRTSTRGQSRLYIPRGETKRLICLSPRPFMFWEHQFRGQNGKWNNWATCLKENGFADHCPLDALSQNGSFPISKSYVGAISILDLSPWTNSDGEEVPYTKRIGILKGDTLGLLEVRMKQKGRIQFLEFEVHRSDKDKSPSAGNIWDVVEEHSKEDLVNEYGEEIVAEHDWKDVFKAPSVEELQVIASFFGVTPEGDSFAPEDEEQAVEY